MNNLLFSICFGLISIYASAQKVDKYCQLTITFKNRGIDLIVDLGKDSSLFSLKDKSVKHKLLSATKYSTPVDVLNYFASMGWTFQQSLPIIQNGGNIGYVFFLKKTFDESEIDSGRPVGQIKTK